MDQHQFVEGRLAYYEEQGLIPGSPDDGDWDECHYPDPRDVGDKTILMLHNDHQQQGLYQSEEYQRPCFYNGDVKRFLDNNWCSNWFELYDLYEKWGGYYGEVCGATNLARMPRGILVANGKANVGVMNDHCNTKAARVTNGKSTGAANGRSGLTKMPRETLAANGKATGPANGKVTGPVNGKANSKITNSQRWQCLVTGFITNPGNLSKYQKARGIETHLRKKLE